MGKMTICCCTFTSNLGDIRTLREIIEKNKVEEAIIALEPSEHENIGHQRTWRFAGDHQNYSDMYDILSGSEEMNAIFGAPLIEISPI